MASVMKLAKAFATATSAGTSSPIRGSFGSGVAQWAGLVRQVLAMEHLNPAYLLDVLYQMQTESGGRVNAINLTDTNATVLHDPSRGLMQVIMSTFLRWHWPGTSFNIYDPLANVAAALNYAAHGRGFGTGPGQVGSGHGYSLGGAIREPVIGFGTRSGERYNFAENGTEWVSRTPPGGRGGGAGPMIGSVYIQLPEGQTVARALTDLNFWVSVAAQQGHAGVPGG
jgi:hypothetical protein